MLVEVCGVWMGGGKGKWEEGTCLLYRSEAGWILSLVCPILRESGTSSHSTA